MALLQILPSIIRVQYNMFAGFGTCHVVLVRIACLIVVKGRAGDPYLSTLRTVVYPSPITVNGRASALSLRSVTVARSDNSYALPSDLAVRKVVRKNV